MLFSGCVQGLVLQAANPILHIVIVLGVPHDVKDWGSQIRSPTKITDRIEKRRGGVGHYEIEASVLICRKRGFKLGFCGTRMAAYLKL